MNIYLFEDQMTKNLLVSKTNYFFQCVASDCCKIPFMEKRSKTSELILIHRSFELIGKEITTATKLLSFGWGRLDTCNKRYILWIRSFGFE